jgi:hypothetical protein
MEHATPSTHTKARRPLLLTALAAGLGIVFDFLFFEKLPGISFPLYIILTLAALVTVAHYEKLKLPKTALYLIPLLLFFSFMVFVRAGDFLIFINVVVTLFLLALFVQLTLKPNLRLYEFTDYSIRLMRLPLRVIAKADEVIRAAVPGRAFFAQHQAVPQVVRGILIAIPVLVLFIVLFSSADLVFREYVDNIFNFNISDELFGQTILFLMVAVTFAGVFGLLGRREIADENVGQTPTKQYKFGSIEMSILFGSLNALFLLFISIQLTYLFGGVGNVIGGEFTFAEYARKGFFELIAVAGLTLLLIFVAERLLLRDRQMHDFRFKLLSGMLIVQVFIIMASAFKRLRLYESAYGFTSARLLSYIFLAWLAVVFALLLYKIFADRREHFFAFSVFVSVMAFLVFINCFNIDGTVARNNIARYEAKGKIDLQYLGSLSSDATTEVVTLLDAKNPKVRYTLASALYPRQQALRQDDRPWQSANLTRKAALRELNKHSALLLESRDKINNPNFYYGPEAQVAPGADL